MLNIKITLLNTDEILYEGLLLNIPESLDCYAAASENKESELYYEVTVSLDTSVGNEYQNKELISDFCWWVEDEGGLEPPQTGDNIGTYVWMTLVSSIMLLILLALKKRNREEREDEQ